MRITSGVPLVYARVLEPGHGVGRVDAAVDDGDVRLAARRGQFALAGLARRSARIDLRLGDQHPRRDALEVDGQPLLVLPPATVTLNIFP